MKEKSRKVTAMLLCCVLAFLSFAAELSHSHGLPARTHGVSLQNAQTAHESSASKKTHDFNCQACHFTCAQHAVSPAAVMLAATTATPFITAALLPRTSQFFFQLSSLRAPPALLA